MPQDSRDGTNPTVTSNTSAHPTHTHSFMYLVKETLLKVWVKDEEGWLVIWITAVQMTS